MADARQCFVVRAVKLVLACALMVVVWGCSSASERTPPGQGTPGAGVGPSSRSVVPLDFPSGDEVDGPDCRSFGVNCLDAGSARDIENRCVGPTQSRDLARLTYQPRVKLKLGADYTYRLTLAPTTISIRLPGSSTEDFLVTCTVRASLEAAADKLGVAPSGFQKQRYFPPEPTEFSWIVTAQEPGTQSATIKLQPVMRVDSGDGEIEDFEGRVEPVVVRFDVAAGTAKPDDDGLVEQTGGFLKGSWNAVVSVATGVAAIAGALSAIHALRKRRRRRAASQVDEPHAGAPLATAEADTGDHEGIANDASTSPEVSSVSSRGTPDGGPPARRSR